MMVPIQVIRWYRMQCYDGTDSCAIVVPIRRYCQLIKQLQKRDPLLANAVNHMAEYIQNRYPAAYPSKEQTEAVNDYLRSVHADGDGTM